jgi:hypothetical protein
MSRKPIFNKNRNGIRCHRCDGPMVVEKFYGENDSFLGWHCLICGAILDPVILLHHLSQDANIVIPENEKEIILLIRKFMSRRSRRNGGQKQNKSLPFHGELTVKN